MSQTLVAYIPPPGIELSPAPPQYTVIYRRPSFWLSLIAFIIVIGVIIIVFLAVSGCFGACSRSSSGTNNNNNNNNNLGANAANKAVNNATNNIIGNVNKNNTPNNVINNNTNKNNTNGGTGRVQPIIAPKIDGYISVKLPQSGAVEYGDNITEKYSNMKLTTSSSSSSSSCSSSSCSSSSSSSSSSSNSGTANTTNNSSGTTNVSEVTCSSACDAKDECKGIWYSGGECYLLPDIPSISGPGLESEVNVYLKKKYRPTIIDRVFIADIRSKLVDQEWWNYTSQVGGKVSVFNKAGIEAVGRTYYLGGKQYDIINGGKLVGVYSTRILTDKESQSALNGFYPPGVTVVTDKPTTDSYILDLSKLTNRTVYVKYFPSP